MVGVEGVVVVLDRGWWAGRDGLSIVPNSAGAGGELDGGKVDWPRGGVRLQIYALDLADLEVGIIMAWAVLMSLAYSFKV